MSKTKEQQTKKQIKKPKNLSNEAARVARYENLNTPAISHEQEVNFFRYHQLPIPQPMLPTWDAAAAAAFSDSSNSSSFDIHNYNHDSNVDLLPKCKMFQRKQRDHSELWSVPAPPHTPQTPATTTTPQQHVNNSDNSTTNKYNNNENDNSDLWLHSLSTYMMPTPSPITTKFVNETDSNYSSNDSNPFYTKILNEPDSNHSEEYPMKILLSSILPITSADLLNHCYYHRRFENPRKFDNEKHD